MLSDLFLVHNNVSFLLMCRRLGWEPKPGESHLNVLLRGEVFTALASFGHDKTHKEAMQRFQELLNDKDTILLSADLKKVKSSLSIHMVSSLLRTFSI